MNEVLNSNLFQPTIEALRQNPNNMKLDDYTQEQLQPYVQYLRDVECALVGLAKFLGQEPIEPGKDETYNAFVKRYEKNLGLFVNNMRLQDGGETIDLSWDELSQGEQDAVASRVLENQQGMLGLLSRLKIKESRVSATDIKRIAVYHKADELRDLLPSDDNGILTYFDICRIYLRNKNPGVMIDSVEEAYLKNQDRISDFEFRELFLRSGEKGVSEFSIRKYLDERDTVSNEYNIPRQLAGTINLRFRTTEDQEKMVITQAVTMVELIKNELRQQLSEEKVNEAINTYFMNFTNCGVFIKDINATKIKDFSNYASQISSAIRSSVSLDNNGNIIARQSTSPITLAKRPGKRKRQVNVNNLIAGEDEAV